MASVFESQLNSDSSSSAASGAGTSSGLNLASTPEKGEGKTDRKGISQESFASAWLTGIELFNQGAYFESHEAWEWRWRELPFGERLHVQSQIQGAGVFVLLGKGRIRAALSLSKRALELGRFEGWANRDDRFNFRIEIPGLKSILEEISLFDGLEKEPETELVQTWLKRARTLQASLIELPVVPFQKTSS